MMISSARAAKGERMMDKLKPCPFCGGQQLYDNIGVHYDESGLSDVRYFYSVVCINCGCRTASFEQKLNAIESWNRRVSDE